MSITKSGLFSRAGMAIVVDSLDAHAYNPAGLPRISDGEHLERALGSRRPHTYIAARAGRQCFEGKDGIGFLNAEELHIRVFRNCGHVNDGDDLMEAHRLSPSFKAAVTWLRVHEPALFKRIENAIPSAAMSTAPASDLS